MSSSVCSPLPVLTRIGCAPIPRKAFKSLNESPIAGIFFKEQANNFIAAQEQIYQDPKNAEAHFNAGVDACIQCHEVKCAGPIARIKKLYIKP